MAKNDNLKDFLTDVADAIREKKGTTDKINPQDFSNEIANIESGGASSVDFSSLEFSDATLNSIKNNIAYSYELKKKFENGEITSFYNRRDLVYSPKINTTGRTSFKGFFSGCTYLSTIEPLDTSSGTNFTDMFSYCLAIKDEVPLDTSNGVLFGSMFWGAGISRVYPYDLSNATGCYAMFRSTQLKICPPLNTPKVTDFGYMFFGCPLKKIESLDFSSVTSINAFCSQTGVTFILIKNLGKSSLSTYDLSSASNWGVDSDDIPNARQSLIDSLITHSYDRATNGMSVATIKLSSTTKALLTEEEIAQITAKGFTLA